MNKKILSILLVLSMLVGMLAAMPLGVMAAGETDTDTWDGSSTANGFAGGSGTVNDPYKIATCAQWIYFANNATTAYYELVKDLDFNGKNIPPVARADGFKGVFNGNGHTIKGVALKNDNEKYDWGLFGKTTGDDVQIRNLVISSSTFTYDDNSGGWSGGLVGEVTAGNLTIENVYIDKDVLITSTKNCIGGFVGGIDGGTSVTINHSVFAGAVNQSGIQNGGFIGNCGGSAIISFNNCLFIGRVGQITNFNTEKESVTVVQGIAGFSGYGKAEGSSINNCVSVGTAYNSFMATGSSKNAGTPKNFALNNSFYTSSTGGVGASDEGTNKEISKARDVVHPYVTDEIMSVLEDWEVRDNDIIVPSGVADFAPSWYVATNTEEWDEDADGAYVIKSVAQWNYFIEQVNDEKNTLSGQTVKLGADIDFGGVTGITPIAKFAGTFDGRGYTMKNLTMSASDDMALFCTVADGAIIQNLHIKNFNITATNQYASAVACCVGGDSEFRNIFVDKDVNINAGDDYAGGIIGYAYGDGATVLVENCVNAGTIAAGDMYVGGIIGQVKTVCSVTVKNCLNVGAVTAGNTYASGIAGAGGSIDISNCINVGSVTSSNREGGIFAGNPSGVVNIDNCYSVGVIYDIATSGSSGGEVNDETSAVIGDVEAELVGKAATVTVDDTLWTKRDGDYMLPTAIVNMFAGSGKAIPQLYVAPALEGEGTVGDPYKIASAEDWETFIYLAGKKNFAGEYVVLTNDIDFEGFSITPIEHFAGTFNGQYHTMRNLTMRLNKEEVALFCTVGSGAVIENLRIENFDIRAKGQYAGAVACCAGENSTFQNIYVHSDVTVEATENYAGGIIGNVFGTDKDVNITNCVFAGTVKAGYMYAGGIVGHINSGNKVTVSNCLNTGTVTASSTYASGIAGASEANIINCVNTGKVKSNNRKGGICSGNPSAAVNITNCYSVDSIADIATSDSNGGTVTVSNCKVVKLTDLIGNNAQVPETFVKRGGDFAVPADMNEYIPTILTQQLYDGASVRISTPTGLRFRALLGVDYLNSINTSGNATFGIIIAPTDFVADRAAFIELVKTGEAGVDYVIIPVNVANGLYFGGADAGYYEFTGVLTNVQTYNYDRPFSAIAYVELDGEYHFSAYDEAKNSRSIEYVAHMAYEDTYYTQVEGYEYEIEAGAGVYSPYTAYQRDNILLPFFNANGTLDINFLSYNIRNIEDEVIEGGWFEADKNVPTYEYTGREDRVLAYLTSCGADIIGLQEVSTLKLSDGTLDWFDVLNNSENGLTANGYNCFIGANLYTGDEYSKELVNSKEKTMYNPIYYKADKYTLIKGGTKWLTDTPDDPSRIPGANTDKALNYVVLEDNDTGVRFVYVNLHTIVLADKDKDGNIIVESENYHTNESDGKLYHIQYMQIAYLRAILEDLQTNEELESCGLPMFIGGDFNNSYSTTTENFNNFVVTTTVNDKGDKIYDVNDKGTPSETVKITSARDTASSKDTMKSCPHGGMFNVTPDKNGTPIDLWYTSNHDGFVHCYQVIDNRFEEPNEAGDNNRYPSDHLPVKLYVTIYR